jgi:hypothetical protein
MFMQITSYEWKLPGLSKGLPAEDAAKEFKRIEQVFGALTPENIVKAAEPQDSLLHKLVKAVGVRTVEVRYGEVRCVAVRQLRYVMVRFSTARHGAVWYGKAVKASSGGASFV